LSSEALNDVAVIVGNHANQHSHTDTSSPYYLLIVYTFKGLFFLISRSNSYIYIIYTVIVTLIHIGLHAQAVVSNQLSITIIAYSKRDKPIFFGHRWCQIFLCSHQPAPRRRRGCCAHHRSARRTNTYYNVYNLVCGAVVRLLII